MLVVLHPFDFTVKVTMPAKTRKAIADYLEVTDYIDYIGLYRRLRGARTACPTPLNGKFI